MASAVRLYSPHPFALDSMLAFGEIPYRNKLRIPCARFASDSIHGFAVIKYENGEDGNGEKEFAFRIWRRIGY